MTSSGNQGLSDLVAALSGMWREILGVESVNPEDNFFVLGGDSLKATILMSVIEEKYGLMLDPVEVFDRPILREFAESLNEMRLETV